MTTDETDPYATVLDAHRKIVAEKEAHTERYRRCEDDLINKWPASIFPSLEREFTDAGLRIDYHLALNKNDDELVPSNGTRKPHISYTVIQRANRRAKALPKLNLELYADCTVHANIKNDAGEPFVIQVDGDMVTEQLRSLLAALLRDSLAAFV